MNKVIFLLLVFAGGCSSLPEGEKRLSQMVEDDQSKVQGTLKTKERVYTGRPLFVRSYAYPQILSNGDIFLGGEYLLSVGREELTLEELTK